MAKKLKLNLTVKNPQLAKVLGRAAPSTKEKELKKKPEIASHKTSGAKEKPAVSKSIADDSEQSTKRRVRAKTKSSFSHEEDLIPTAIEESSPSLVIEESVELPLQQPIEESVSTEEIALEEALSPETEEPFYEDVHEEEQYEEEITEEIILPPAPPSLPPAIEEIVVEEPPVPKKVISSLHRMLGPTGRHINDIREEIQKKEEENAKIIAAEKKRVAAKKAASTPTQKPQSPASIDTTITTTEAPTKKAHERESLANRRQVTLRPFTAKDRRFNYAGGGDESQQWRRQRKKKGSSFLNEAAPIRPKTLLVRLPLSIKDFAAALKIKSSEIISSLFMQGMIMTLNDVIDDETTLQLIGSEFGCDVTIDTSEEERIRITDKSISEEIAAIPPENLRHRPPVITFMGHVDHGKTSLIDAIRKSHVAESEKGAITQHIGAFSCHTSAGDITIIDTPGHAAFSSMRARGAVVTDIVILVIAGDEGIRQQTIEAIKHAQESNVIIVVAINKCDKPNFDAETVYRQLADNSLLPEAWGGSTITVNCSAVTGEGIDTLLEMVALQAEVLELSANPAERARGSVIESEMRKGLGITATLLVQNGTLKMGDAVVFSRQWGRIKTMHNDKGVECNEVGPSGAVEVTGLSSLPEAGSEFIVVSDEREARNIAEIRAAEQREKMLYQKSQISLESLMEHDASKAEKMILNIILRSDTQGALEALKQSLLSIESDKAAVSIVSAAVGEIAESDIQLAAAANATIIGFHTQVESHAESMIKQLKVTVRLHDIIYHAVDDTKLLLKGLLPPLIKERDVGKAEVKATFKASQIGVITGCMVTEGTIHRNNRVRVIRDGEQVWKGRIASIKREKNDVRDVSSGFECGILLDGYNNAQIGDMIEAFEITETPQEL